MRATGKYARPLIWTLQNLHNRFCRFCSVPVSTYDTIRALFLEIRPDHLMKPTHGQLAGAVPDSTATGRSDSLEGHAIPAGTQPAGRELHQNIGGGIAIFFIVSDLIFTGCCCAYHRGPGEGP